jgi:hypothetical protein
MRPLGYLPRQYCTNQLNNVQTETILQWLSTTFGLLWFPLSQIELIIYNRLPEKMWKQLLFETSNCKRADKRTNLWSWSTFFWSVGVPLWERRYCDWKLNYNIIWSKYSKILIYILQNVVENKNIPYSHFCQYLGPNEETECVFK